jgi:hypothetical protein
MQQAMTRKIPDVTSADEAINLTSIVSVVVTCAVNVSAAAVFTTIV